MTDQGPFTGHVFIGSSLDGFIARQFLQAGLIVDITITTVPVLLGSGIPFPGELEADIPLIHQSTKVFGAGLVQSTYAVDR